MPGMGKPEGGPMPGGGVMPGGGRMKGGGPPGKPGGANWAATGMGALTFPISGGCLRTSSYLSSAASLVAECPP